MPLTTTKRWGDDADDDDDVELDTLQTSNDQSSSNDFTTGTNSSSPTIPPTHVSRIDSKGIKIVTSYRANPSNSQTLLKTVTKIRVQQLMTREHLGVEKRRKWKKFGQAAIDGDDQSNVTIQSRDDVYLEDPHQDVDLQDEDVTKALAGNLNAFWDKQRRRQVERKYGIEEGEAKEGSGVGGREASDGWHKVGDKAASSISSGAPTTNKYVPPSARNPSAGAGGGLNEKGRSLAAMASRMGDRPDNRMQDNRDQNTIRVTNISEDTTEADLQELFGRFGRISRVYVAKDKETMQSRGFAFVSFTDRKEAAKAMDKLQGYGYDHLILKLEWARPSAPKDSTTYRSGYGQALAQDTKAKVSYASNLTR